MNDRVSASVVLPGSGLRGLGVSLMAVACLAVAGTVFLWDGGTLESETIAFISQYSADRPLLHRIFDPHANDFGTYQARELSYLFDCLDAYVYLHVVGPLAGHFLIPASSLLIPFLFALVFLRGIRSTAPRLDGITATLLFGCFASCFVFLSTLGLFYRSAKALVALTLLALLFHLLRVGRCSAEAAPWRPQHWRRDAVVTFVLALVVGLLDRQGAFYVVAASGIMLLHFWITRRAGTTAMALAAAAVALQVYNLWLGPAIIRLLNGYWPNFDYQRIPYHEVPDQFRPAFQFLWENGRVMLGGFSGVTFTVLGLAGLLLIWPRWRETMAGLRHPPVIRAAVYASLGLGALLILHGAMILRHPPVFHWLDHRYWYYPLPFLALLLFVLVVGTNAILPRLGVKGLRVLQLLLGVVLIGNVASLPHYRDIMLGGPWFSPVRAQSELLKSSLRTGIPHPYLASNYRKLFDELQAAWKSGRGQ
jgi:hypothetical protein